MKYIKIFVILAVIAIPALVWKLSPTVDTEGKIHTNIYQNAKGVQSMNLSASPFNPQEIHGEEIGSSTYLRIEWSKPKKEYNHFLLTITDLESKSSRIESGERDRTSLDVTDLEANQTYVFALQACLDPTCKQWYVSETELLATTPKRYWQLDGEHESLYGLQAFTYEPTANDILKDILFSEDDVLLPPESITDWNGGQNVLTDQANIYWINGSPYNQKILIPLQSDPAISSGIVSATLINL
jgi:hypothetical protein